MSPMRRWGRIATAAAAALLSGLPAAGAQEQEQRVFREDLYVAGGRVVVDQDVPGDLVAAGGTVLVRGRVGEDALIAGGTVDLDADVGDVVRVGAGNVKVRRAIGGYLVAGGGSVELLPTATVAGGMFVNAGQARVLGTVRGPLEVRGGDVRLDGTVEGDVKVYAGRLALGHRAVIRKELAYDVRNPVEIAGDAQLLGPVRRFSDAGVEKAGRHAALLVVPWLAKVLGLLFTGVALVLLFPRVTRAFAAEALGHFGRDAAVGATVLLVGPAAVVLLLASVVGLPLGVIGGFAYLALLPVSIVGAGVILGSFVWKRAARVKETRADWKTAALGLLLLAAIAWVPVLGWILAFALVVTALGGVSVLAYRGIHGTRVGVPAPAVPA